MKSLLVAIALCTLSRPAPASAQVPSSAGWSGPSSSEPSRGEFDTSERPLARLSAAQLNVMEASAWEPIGGGIGLLLGGLAVGLGAGIPLGLESRRFGPVTSCFISCTTSRGVIGHDSGLLTASLSMAVIGAATILVGGLAFIMPGNQRRHAVRHERRARERAPRDWETTALAVDISADGGLMMIAGRF